MSLSITKQNLIMRSTFLLFLVIPFFTFSQVLLEDNFDSYAEGPVSTDLSGETAGPSGYFVEGYEYPDQTTTNFSENTATFAPVPGGSQGLKLVGPNGNEAQLYVVDYNLEEAWNNRDAGNDILKISVDFSASGTDEGNVYAIYAVTDNEDVYKIATGFFISTMGAKFDGIGYGQDAVGDIGNVIWNLVNPNAQYAVDSMQTVSCTFSKATGEISYTVNGHTYSYSGLSAGEDVVRLYFWVASSYQNTNTNDGYFDNLLVEAVSSLSTAEVTTNAKTTIYPNPAKNEINLSLNRSFNANKTKVSITNMQGQLILTSKFSETMDISQLPKGVYVVQFSDGKSTESQKLIVK